MQGNGPNMYMCPASKLRKEVACGHCGASGAASTGDGCGSESVQKSCRWSSATHALWAGDIWKIWFRLGSLSWRDIDPTVLAARAAVAAGLYAFRASELALSVSRTAASKALPVTQVRPLQKPSYLLSLCHSISVTAARHGHLVVLISQAHWASSLHLFHPFSPKHLTQNVRRRTNTRTLAPRSRTQPRAQLYRPCRAWSTAFAGRVRGSL